MPCQYGRRTDDGDGARMDMVKPKRILLHRSIDPSLVVLGTSQSLLHLLLLPPSPPLSQSSVLTHPSRSLCTSPYCTPITFTPLLLCSNIPSTQCPTSASAFLGSVFLLSRNPWISAGEN